MLTETSPITAEHTAIVETVYIFLVDEYIDWDSVQVKQRSIVVQSKGSQSDSPPSYPP